VFSFDVTLIVQMINFFMVWWFIDKFLFKKLVLEIHHEDTFSVGLQKKLDQESENLSLIMQQKDVDWKQYKELYKDQIPSKNISYPVSQDIIFTPPVELTEQAKHVLINEISYELVREIAHD